MNDYLNQLDGIIGPVAVMSLHQRGLIALDETPVPGGSIAAAATDPVVAAIVRDRINGRLPSYVL